MTQRRIDMAFLIITLVAGVFMADAKETNLLLFLILAHLVIKEW